MRKLVPLVAVAVIAVIFAVSWQGEHPGDRHSAPRDDRLDPDKSASTPVDRGAPNDALGLSPVQRGEHLVTGVWGTVIGPDGPVAGATVYAHLSDAEPLGDRTKGNVAPNLPESETVTDASGAFALKLPQRGTGIEVDVGALKQGLRRAMTERVFVPPGGRARCDLELGRGAAIQGRVIDRDGNAVAGLDLFVTATRLPHYRSPMMTSWLLDQSEYRYARFGSPYHESSGVTNEQGEFTIGGLDPGHYSLVSRDFEWLVNPNVWTEAPAQDVLVTVDRALRLTGTIRDADTGDPVPRALLRLAARPAERSRPYHKAGTVLGGTIGFAWLHPASNELPRELALTIQITANGYVPHSEEIALSTAVGEKEMVIPLRRRATARLDISVTFDDGSPYTRAIVLDYAESRNNLGGLASVQHGTLRPERTPDGRFECALPAGAWFVHIRPDGPLGHALRQRTEISLVEGERQHLSFTIPRGGQVEIRRPDRPKVGAAWTLIAVGTNLSAAVELAEPVLTLEDVPVGDWEFLLRRDGEHAGSKSVDVQRGARVAIAFEGGE